MNKKVLYILLTTCTLSANVFAAADSGKEIFHNVLAVREIESGGQDAVRMALKTIEVAGDRVQTTLYYNLGKAYQKINDYENARIAFDQLISAYTEVGDKNPASPIIISDAIDSKGAQTHHYLLLVNALYYNALMANILNDYCGVVSYQGRAIHIERHLEQMGYMDKVDSSLRETSALLTARAYNELAENADGGEQTDTYYLSAYQSFKRYFSLKTTTAKELSDVLLAANIALAVGELGDAQQWFNEYMDTVSFNPSGVNDKEKVRDVVSLILDKIVDDEFQSLFDEDGNYKSDFEQELETKKEIIADKLEKILKFNYCTVDGNSSDDFVYKFSMLRAKKFKNELKLSVAFSSFLNN